MTNKFRRSMASVLLAASLLFSSQSVVAFADYGSKSDASDLSPVQESVEPVIGEIQAMMAMPLSGNEGVGSQVNDGKVTKDVQIDENKKFTLTLGKNDLPAIYGENGVILPITKLIAVDNYIVSPNHINSPELIFDSSNETITVTGILIDNWESSTPSFVIHSYTAIYGDSGIGNPRSWSATIYLNVTEKPVDPTEPEIPEDILKKIQVRFDCETNDQHYVNSNHNLVDDFTEGEHYTIEFFEDDTKATITLQGDKLVEYYDTKHPGETHQFKEMTRGEGTNEEKTDSISLTLNGDKWEFDNKGNPNDIHFTVKMNCTPEVPEKPYAPNLYELLGNVSVVCDTAPKSHNTSYSFKDLSEYAEYTVTRPTLVDNVYQCTVSVNAQAILNKYNGSDATHTLVEEASVTGPVTLTWKNNEWTVDNFVKGSLTVKIHCESEPWTPIVPFPTDDNIKALLNGKIQVVCDTVKEHAVKTYGGEVEGGYTPSNEIKFDGTNYTYDLTINYNPYVAEYNDEPNAKKHGLVGTVNSCYVVLKWVPEKDGIAAHWALENDADPLVTIPVKCDIPFLTETDLAKGFIKFECLNNEEHDSSSTYLNNFVDGTFKVEYTGNTATVKPADPVSLVSNWKSGHMYVKSDTPEQITFTYSKDTGWTVDESKNTITVKMICAPTIDEINAKLDVSVDCNNANANPEHKAMIFEDLLADSYEIGTPELSGSEYICDVTVKAEKYVTEYDKEYRPEHSNADNQTVTFKFKDGKWTLESDPISVNFIVTCDFPNGPSEDEIAELGLKLQLNCATTPNSHGIVKYDVTNKNTFEVSDVIYTDAADAPSHYYVNVTVDGSSYLTQYNNDKGVHSWVGSNEAVFKVYARELEIARKTEYIWNIVDSETMTLQVQHTNPTDPTDPGTNPGGNGGDNDDDDDRYTGGNTVTRTINDDDVPLNDRPTNTPTIDDEDVPLADLPDDTVTIDDGEVPLKANPSTGDSLPFAAMAAAALSLGGVIVLNRKKK